MEAVFGPDLKDALLMLPKSTVQWACSEQYNRLDELQRSFPTYIVLCFYVHLTVTCMSMYGMCVALPVRNPYSGSTFKSRTLSSFTVPVTTLVFCLSYAKNIKQS